MILGLDILCNLQPLNLIDHEIKITDLSFIWPLLFYRL